MKVSRQVAGPSVLGADARLILASLWPKVLPLVVLVVMLLLATAAWWLIGRLTEASRIQDCVMSGRKNCAPIDTDGLGK